MTDIFIQKANKIHNDRYDYSIVDYKHSKKKIKIKCKIHDIFEQSPNSHLKGRNCPKCANEIVMGRTKTQKQFIIDANKVHHNRYDYSLVKYINCKTKIIIICPKHKQFLQKPNSHLNNRGCPRCKRSKGEEAVAKLLENRKIFYVDQYIFDKLPNRHYDFYLPEYNTIIEYHGEQHYKFSKFFHKTKEEMLKRRQRDKEKYEFCIVHNIKFEEISYKENIEKKLNSICNTFKLRETP